MKLLRKDVIANNPVLYFLGGFVAVACVFRIFSTLKDTTTLLYYLSHEDKEENESK